MATIFDRIPLVPPIPVDGPLNQMIPINGPLNQGIPTIGNKPGKPMTTNSWNMTPWASKYELEIKPGQLAFVWSEFSTAGQNKTLELAQMNEVLRRGYKQFKEYVLSNFGTKFVKPNGRVKLPFSEQNFLEKEEEVILTKGTYFNNMMDYINDNPDVGDRQTALERINRIKKKNIKKMEMFKKLKKGAGTSLSYGLVLDIHNKWKFTGVVLSTDRDVVSDNFYNANYRGSSASRRYPQILVINEGFCENAFNRWGVNLKVGHLLWLILKIIKIDGSDEYAPQYVPWVGNNIKQAPSISDLEYIDVGGNSAQGVSIFVGQVQHDATSNASNELRDKCNGLTKTDAKDALMNLPHLGQLTLIVGIK